MQSVISSIARCDAEQSGTAGQIRFVGVLLDRVLGRFDAGIEHCTLTPFLVAEGNIGSAERVSDVFSIRARSDQRLLLRASAARERIVAAIPDVVGQTVAIGAFADWLDGFGLGSALSCHASIGAVIISQSAASLPLTSGAKADAEGISAAFTAAFALSSVAHRLAGDRGLVPLGVGRAWRSGAMPVTRAVVALRAERGNRIYVDCLLVDEHDDPVLVMTNVCFVPIGDAAQWAIIDFKALAAHGQVAIEARLLDMFATRLAELLEMEPGSVPLEAPLSSTGVDSLTAAELRGQATLLLGADLPLNQLSPTSTLRDFARIAAAELQRLYAPHDDRYGVTRYLNPAMAELLRLARLDRAYVRGVGSILTDADGREVIDFVAQYGALPFGHNPRGIWDALIDLRDQQAPLMVGLSIPVAAGRLAERLTWLAPPGLDRAFFCSSGAEAIEAAIKLTRAATGRTGVLSTTGGFHGLTLAALSATGRETYQQPSGPPLLGSTRFHSAKSTR